MYQYSNTWYEYANEHAYHIHPKLWDAADLLDCFIFELFVQRKLSFHHPAGVSYMTEDTESYYYNHNVFRDFCTVLRTFSASLNTIAVALMLFF